MPLALPALMTLLAILWYFCTLAHVALAHNKYKVFAPAMSPNTSVSATALA